MVATILFNNYPCRDSTEEAMMIWPDAGCPGYVPGQGNRADHHGRFCAWSSACENTEQDTGQHVMSYNITIGKVSIWCC